MFFILFDKLSSEGSVVENLILMKNCFTVFPFLGAIKEDWIWYLFPQYECSKCFRKKKEIKEQTF